MLTEREGALLASIGAANAVRLDDEIIKLAEKYGAEFTPQCIQPWELLEASRFEALAPDRQKHIEGCFSCALTFNHQPALGSLAAKAAEEAAMWEPARLPRVAAAAAAAAAATENPAPRRAAWQYLRIPVRWIAWIVNAVKGSLPLRHRPAPPAPREEARRPHVPI